MSKTLTPREAAEIMKRIEAASGDRKKLEAIKAILEEYDSDEPPVKELIRKLGR